MSSAAGKEIAVYTNTPNLEKLEIHKDIIYVIMSAWVVLQTNTIESFRLEKTFEILEPNY